MIKKLVMMANQIARNLEIKGPTAAEDAVAEHIELYWDPRMKHCMAAHVEQGGEGLSPIALAALKKTSSPSESA